MWVAAAPKSAQLWLQVVRFRHRHHARLPPTCTNHSYSETAIKA